MDLKPYYDRVISLQANTQGILAKIDDALKLGTPEGETEALAMKEELETAMAEQEKVEGFYNTLLKASKTATNPVKNFLPVAQSEIEDEATTPKLMTVAEYQALAPKDRLAYVKAGGKLE
jgi:hypothetical protein